MARPKRGPDENSWDPMGCLMSIVLLVGFGAAILYLIGWARGLFAK